MYVPDFLHICESTLMCTLFEMKMFDNLCLQMGRIHWSLMLVESISELSCPQRRYQTAEILYCIYFSIHSLLVYTEFQLQKFFTIFMNIFIFMLCGSFLFVLFLILNSQWIQMYLYCIIVNRKFSTVSFLYTIKLQKQTEPWHTGIVLIL